ncbi:hypothetical protein NQ315_010084 [Exocentrus adspersus]|uniref:Uncharacterized protein n=1 Tax=Exocentrus adspersus TaxID=1586481 RepID=A0AAV8WAB2_9CUCU|nr:hypothetical protein NQ315_010084 [Exocentrus adspersus]
MYLYLLLFLPIISTKCLESAQYLQSAVRDLRKLNYRQTLRRADTAMVSAAATAAPQADVPVASPARRIQHGDDVPPISLTKGELAALYEAAVAKGETLKLDTGDDSYIHAAVHELDSESHKEPGYHLSEHSAHSPDSSDPMGYYYYYYPIKSFLDELSSQPSSSAHEYSYKPAHKPIGATHRPHYQYHSHHHQHNITINKEMMEDKKPNKSLEPLFMAISGFIGMAVMFIFTVLIMPWLGMKAKPNKLFGKKNDKFEDFARLAIDAIEGGSCAERFACELSKTARAFNIQDNRFVKLLKRVAPGTFAKHIDRVGTYTNKQLKCTAIPCKKKNDNNNNNPQKKKNNNPPKKH